MSTEQNTIILEHAMEVAERWTGTAVEKAIHFGIAQGNLEVVQQIVKETEYEEELAHSENRDPMTDDRAEAMFTEIEAEDVY